MVQFQWDFFELAGDVSERIARHGGATGLNHRRVCHRNTGKPYTYASGYLADKAFPPAITAANRVIPVFPAGKRCGYIYAWDFARKSVCK